MVNKIKKYLSSLRFTILLISLLGLMFLLGLWIPQIRMMKQFYIQWKANSPNLVAVLDAFQLTDIYTSPIMLTLWGFFFLNLALVMWQRLPLLKKRITLSEAKISDPTTAGGYSFRNSYPLPANMDAATVFGYLRKRGYTLLGDGNGFYGVKNRLSPIAFGLFHLSFFLILAGGLTSFYSQFIAYLELAEGETFQGEVERYMQRPAPTMPKIGSPPKVAFTIKSIVPVVSGYTETGLKVQLVDARGRNHDLDINRPYNDNSTSFVLKNLGMAPLFVLKDPAGKEIDGAFVKLNVLKGATDRFSLGGFEFKARFFPDYVLENGKDDTRSLEFNNPVFNISVMRDGKKIAEGAVPRNGTLEFAGYRLEMQELRYWVRFSVLKEHGIAIVYTGFAIACLAIIWRLLLYRREIVGAVREERGERHLVVAARSEFYKSLAEDEFIKLFSNMLEKSG
jgi:cytochrome c biogenesis protein ResB